MKQTIGLVLSGIAFMLLELGLFSRISMSPLGPLMIYPLFLFRLPATMPKGWYLFTGFAFGLVLDLFLQTGGLHAAAASAFCFFRPAVFGLYFTKDDLEDMGRPSITRLGLAKFLLNFGILVLIHQLFFHVYAMFRADLMVMLGLKWITGSLLSLVVMVLIHGLFVRR